MKVMTYNIWNGGEGREQSILEVIQSVQPDIVVLQEVYNSTFLQNLGMALNMHAYFGEGNRKRRVALLCRLPIRSVNSQHPASTIWNNVIEAEIECFPGSILKLFGIHAKANLGILWEWKRWQEAKYILGQANQHTDKPCLIAGDFNAIAPNDTVVTSRMPKWLKLTLCLQGNRVYRFSIRAYLQAGFTDSFRDLNNGEEGFTLPPPNPNARLDYILVNSVLKQYLKKCWVVREPFMVEKASDHYPVVAEFEF